MTLKPREKVFESQSVVGAYQMRIYFSDALWAQEEFSRIQIFLFLSIFFIGRESQTRRQIGLTGNGCSYEIRVMFLFQC